MVFTYLGIHKLEYESSQFLSCKNKLPYWNLFEAALKMRSDI